MERCKSAARRFPALPGASRTNGGGNLQREEKDECFLKPELPAPVKIAKPELPVPVGVNDNRVHYVHGKSNAAADEVKGVYEYPLKGP